MKKSEMLRILVTVCASYRGTLDDHKQIQSILQFLEGVLKDETATEEASGQ